MPSDVYSGALGSAYGQVFYGDPASGGGYNVYRRALIDGADEFIAFVPAGTEQFLATGLPDSEQWFHVKALTRCGVEDIEPVRIKRVAFDADGNLILPVPNAPIGLTVVCGASGAMSARWMYIPNSQGAAPALFNVYVGTDEDDVDLLDPVETVAYSGSRVFTASLGTFDHGTVVHVIVRAEAASGAEERNVTTASGIADAEAPTPATALDVEVIAS